MLYICQEILDFIKMSKNSTIKLAKQSHNFLDLFPIYSILFQSVKSFPFYFIFYFFGFATGSPVFYWDFVRNPFLAPTFTCSVRKEQSKNSCHLLWGQWGKRPLCVLEQKFFTKSFSSWVFFCPVLFVSPSSTLTSLFLVLCHFAELADHPPACIILLKSTEEKKIHNTTTAFVTLLLSLLSYYSSASKRLSCIRSHCNRLWCTFKD